jgi:hypothetical protein
MARKEATRNSSSGRPYSLQPSPRFRVLGFGFWVLGSGTRSSPRLLLFPQGQLARETEQEREREEERERERREGGRERRRKGGMAGRKEGGRGEGGGREGPGLMAAFTRTSPRTSAISSIHTHEGSSGTN